MLPNHSEVITVSRQQLYEEIWTTPATTLAKRYGVSDVALAKICRKHKIPKPSLGYWARVAHGKVTKQEPLPKLDDERLQQIRIVNRSSARQEDNLRPETIAALAAEDVEANRIHVPTHLEELHPLVERTLKRLRSAAKDERGLVRATAPQCLDIAVGPNSVERAVRIMDALVKALEGRGFPIWILEDDRKRLTCVKVMGETLHIQVRESTNRMERQLTPTQRKEREQSSWMHSYHKYDFIPSGRIALYIESDEYLGGSRVIWSDGTKQRIEHCLNSFICGLLKAANAVKVVRAERERQDREWKKQERRRLQEEERIRKEKERIRDLETEVASWEKSRMIRRYLSVVKEAAIKKYGRIRPESELSQWLSWGHRYADSIDLLVF